MIETMILWLIFVSILLMKLENIEVNPHIGMKGNFILLHKILLSDHRITSIY